MCDAIPNPGQEVQPVQSEGLDESNEHNFDVCLPTEWRTARTPTKSRLALLTTFRACHAAAYHRRLDRTSHVKRAARCSLERSHADEVCVGEASALCAQRRRRRQRPARRFMRSRGRLQARNRHWRLMRLVGSHVRGGTPRTISRTAAGQVCWIELLQVSISYVLCGFVLVGRGLLLHRVFHS